MTPTPSPLSPIVNSHADTLNTSGGASGTWYIHTQTLAADTIRVNEYDPCTSSVVQAPVVASNHLKTSYIVTVNTVLEYGSSYSDDSEWRPQTLSYTALSGGASGGLGELGRLDTSVAGYYRRPAQTNTKGIIIDTTGVCTREGVAILDKRSGAYNGSVDTSTTLNGVIHNLVANTPRICAQFSVPLVDI